MKTGTLTCSQVRVFFVDELDNINTNLLRILQMGIIRQQLFYFSSGFFNITRSLLMSVYLRLHELFFISYFLFEAPITEAVRAVIS